MQHRHQENRNLRHLEIIRSQQHKKAQINIYPYISVAHKIVNDKCVVKNNNKPEEENKKQFTQLTKEEILNFVKGQKQKNKDNHQYEKF
jgi:hypothetical protein